MWVLGLLGLCLWTCDSKDNTDTSTRGDLFTFIELPRREGTRPETTTGIPHVQIDVEAVPAVNDELIERVYSLPGVEDRISVVAPWRGLWLNETVNVAIPQAVIGDSREFAHIHADGSLHLFLPPGRAIEAEQTGWAVLHPFALERIDGWDGFVMLYTPQTLEELDVTFQLIVDGYNYVTSQTVAATDFYE